MDVIPQFPLYIVSKGRADSRLTSKSLEEMKCPYFIVIEDQEYEKYSAVIDKKKILVLDKTYQEKYETFDDLGTAKSKGPGAARNFAWDHSISNGHKWHWVMDDNINRFYRLHQNMKIPVKTPAIFKAMEDFCLRYTNVGMAGPHYCMFAPRKNKIRPFMINTRIYSCNLIRNDIPFRWRGRYNEDTDLSLNILKAGMCTIQFYAFLQMKMPTQVIAGGNTADFYAKEGTLPKSIMLYRMHPDVTKVIHKFRRWHHVVDYSRFQANRLIKAETVATQTDKNYGMKLVKVK